MIFKTLRWLSWLVLSLPTMASDTDSIAQDYVTLVLTLGNHDPGYIDAYYGPPEWREEARESPLSPVEIAVAARRLQQRLPAAATAVDEMTRLRLNYLRTQLQAMAAYAESLTGARERDFDREAQAFYDTRPPQQPLTEYDAILVELAALLPGDGPLDQRIDRFYQAYEIPAEKLSAVFDAAIAACRQRTRKHISLPPEESFELEYVTDKPWSGYNWYQGNAHSLIQVNTDLPIRIDRAIDLGCHEGYPGHHAYNALLEAEFVNRRGWVEFTVYPLFSPQSLIAEGTANYGIELAFPGAEKLAFEQAELYPLAGLDPASAPRYDRIQRITERLGFARNEIARRYINGGIDRATAIEVSRTYGPMSQSRAEQSLRFIDTYGAYVINYNWGKQLVAEYVERNADSAEQRWARFAALLASPRLPSDLTAPGSKSGN